MAPVPKSGKTKSIANRPGFSMIELMIVGAVLVSLATLGGFACQSYMLSVQTTLGD